MSTFLGPNSTRFARCRFRAQKSLNFQGPFLPMALVMDIARIKIIMYRDIKTTGTSIVKMYHGCRSSAPAVTSSILKETGHQNSLLRSSHSHKIYCTFNTYDFTQVFCILKQIKTQHQISLKQGVGGGVVFFRLPRDALQVCPCANCGTRAKKVRYKIFAVFPRVLCFGTAKGKKPLHELYLL